MKAKKKDRSKNHRISSKKRKRHHEEEKVKDDHASLDIQNAPTSASDDDDRKWNNRKVVISSESSSPSSTSPSSEMRKKEQQQNEVKKEKKKSKKRQKRSVDAGNDSRDDDETLHTSGNHDGNDTKVKKKKKEKKSKRKKKEKKKEKRNTDIDLDKNDEDEAEQQQQKKSKRQKTTTQMIKSGDNADGDENAKKDNGDEKNDRTVASSAVEFYENIPPPRIRPLAVHDPKATTNAANSITILLFYQYVEPVWDEYMYDYVLKTLQKFGNELKLTGRMRVAKEGLNCTLTGSHASITEYCQRLRTHPKFNNAFQDTEFKLTTDLPMAQKFPELKVFKVVELVHYGLEGSKAPPIAQYQGTHLEPKDYHKKIAENNTVIIDVRNHYEAAIGRFVPPREEKAKEEMKEQTKKNGESNDPPPKWLDPLMRKSTEFPVWLDKPETKEEMKGKQVLMYCTGGIRCERASALLKYKMETDPEITALGIKGVYQLQGGIDKYFKEFPDGGYWKGKNYVFDKRFSHAPPKVDAVLHSGTGGSGSLDKQEKQENAAEDKKKAAASQTESRDGEASGDIKQEKNRNLEDEKKIDIMGQCEACHKPWDMYRGKRRCPSCGVPSLICRDCFQQKKLLKNVRCDLCVAQGITSKKELRQRDVAEIQNYERRMSQKGLLRPEKNAAAPNPNGVTRLVLKNMCRKNMDEEALMGQFNGITHIVWKIERKSGKFLGQAWVEMATPEDAARAVSKDGKLHPFGRPLYVSYQPPDGKDLWPPPNSAVGR